MAALPPKADMAQHDRDVRFVPKAEIGATKLTVTSPRSRTVSNCARFLAFHHFYREPAA
jgi:hypothetical protein